MLTPGEASPTWMRGWKAAVDACFDHLVAHDRMFKPVSSYQLDDQLERLGLLDPEAPGAEEDKLRRQLRVVEAELVLERAKRARAEVGTCGVGWPD